LPAASALYAELAPIVDPDAVGLSVDQQAQRFIDALASICRDCKVPRTLAEVGVRESDLDRLAEDALKQTRLLVNNPRDLTLEDAHSIYGAALRSNKLQAL
jgi:alcohol dehydrogenase class IV